MRGDCHAGCIGTVVAGCTVTNDTSMIEHRRHKGATGYVTDTAIFQSVLVNCVIRRPDYRSSVMTGIACYTHTRNCRAGVVDKRIEKVSRVVADTAIFQSVLMNCRIRRPSDVYVYPSIIAIVAGNTIAGDACVQKRCYRRSEPGISHRMADVTILDGRQMVA